MATPFLGLLIAIAKKGRKSQTTQKYFFMGFDTINYGTYSIRFI
jgi:hypothetical protein